MGELEDADLVVTDCWPEGADEAMVHPACRVIAAKAFLLHAQNAALEWAFTHP